MPSPAPRLTFIPDLLEEHFEELQFLWRRRQSALRSPIYTIRELAKLEDRIEAHAQGLQAVGERALPLLEEGLAGGEPLAAFAAAFAMLRLGIEPAVSRVLDEFAHAKGARLDGLRQALCHAAPSQHLPRIESLFVSAPAPCAAAAAEVLAFRSAARPTAAQVERFLHDEDPAVQTSGWRTVGYLALVASPKSYAAAMRDDDALVKRTAIAAAAWSAHAGIVALGRQRAERPEVHDQELLRMLGILGAEEDVRRIAALAAATELGPARFEIAGSFGHPALVESLLSAMVDPDAETAAAAGAAFSKITGQSVDSARRAKVPMADGEHPDDFDAEFQDEIILPDAALARRHWETAGLRFVAATRVCRGFDVSHGASPEAFASLDMESRWELSVRSKFYGGWSGSPISLELFPHRRQ